MQVYTYSLTTAEAILYRILSTRSAIYLRNRIGTFINYFQYINNYINCRTAQEKTIWSTIPYYVINNYFIEGFFIYTISLNVIHVRNCLYVSFRRSKNVLKNNHLLF